MDVAVAGALPHVRNAASGPVAQVPMNTAPTPLRDGSRVRRANLRTGFILAGIALVFFVGIIATRFVGDSAIGMSVVSLAILLFLVIAIGRNLRK